MLHLETVSLRPVSAHILDTVFPVVGQQSVGQVEGLLGVDSSSERAGSPAIILLSIRIIRVCRIPIDGSRERRLRHVSARIVREACIIRSCRIVCEHANHVALRPQKSRHIVLVLFRINAGARQRLAAVNHRRYHRFTSRHRILVFGNVGATGHKCRCSHHQGNV